MEKKEEKKALLEKDRTVVLSVEDANNIRNFWEHFKIPANDKLSEALTLFEKAQTYENQEAVKIAVCNCIATSDHPAFVDSMIQGIREESTQVSYRNQFDKDLSEVLTVSEAAATQKPEGE